MVVLGEPLFLEKTENLYQLSLLKQGLLFVFSCFCFEIQVSLCSPGWPGTDSIAQARLILAQEVLFDILLFLLKYLLIFMCMNVLPTCVDVHHVCTWYLQKSEESTRSPGTGVTDSWDLPQWLWGSNLVLCKSSKHP